jgi:hypothetical protein
MQYRTSLPLHRTEGLEAIYGGGGKNKSKSNNRTLKQKRKAHNKQLKACGKRTFGCKVVNRRRR